MDLDGKRCITCSDCTLVYLRFTPKGPQLAEKGKCKMCEKGTGHTGIRLCPACSSINSKCEICMKVLTAEDLKELLAIQDQPDGQRDEKEEEKH